MSGNGPEELGFAKPAAGAVAGTSGDNAHELGPEGRRFQLEPVLAADLWLAEKICEHSGIRAALFHGALDDAPTRRERLRAAILANGLSTFGLGRHRGKLETYAAHFRRRFGQEL